MTQAVRKPNLFIIGAMKSGTTSLHEYLNTHPQIGMSRKKEPGFFVEELNLSKGEDWYLSLFEQDDRYRYLGESSTHYTMLPAFQGVPQRIFRFNPEARLIYIMRNPLERTLSHYRHAVRVRNYRKGRGEPRGLLKAVKEEPRYLAFSDYATQLEPYITVFGKDSLYALTFEALVQNAQREVDRIYRWLGLPPHPLGEQSSQAHNQKPQDLTSVAGAGVLYRIQFSAAWDRLSPHVPMSLKRLAKKLAYRPVDAKQSLEDVTRLRAEIGDVQRRQTEALCRMLGRDFPEWRAEGESTVDIRTASASFRASRPQ